MSQHRWWEADHPRLDDGRRKLSQLLSQQLQVSRRTRAHWAGARCAKGLTGTHATDASARDGR